MATPSHAARRFSWRALAGAIVLAGTLTLGAFAPSIVVAQEGSSGYLGYDTPRFAAGANVLVQTDDGGGLSLRFEPSVDAEKLSALGDGDVVSIVAGPEYDGYGNGWYLVTDGALRAYAYAGFLAASSQQPAASSEQPAVSSQQPADDGGYLGYDTPQFSEGASVVVQTDDGGGLSLREGPGTSSEKLSAAGDGDILTIVDGPIYDGSNNGWYLVSDGSLRAYAYAGFLAGTATSSQTSAASSESSTAGSSSSGYLGYDTPQFSEGATVTVQTDDGGGLSLRADASVDAGKLSAAGDGATLTIVSGPVYDGSNNGWYLVSDGSIRAFAYAGFLVGSSQQPAASSQSSDASNSSDGYLGYETPQFNEGATVEVRTDDGGGLSLRSEPSVSSEKLSAVRDGSTLTIVDGPAYDGANNGWYLVSDGSIRAYAFAGFLAGSTASGPTSVAGDSSETNTSSGYLGYDTPQFSEGQSAEIRTDDGGGLSLRSEPSVSSEQLAATRDGSTVTIVDGPVYDGSNNGWYLVSNGSIRAYAYAGFLVGAASSQQPAASGETSTASSSSSGYLGFDTPQFNEGQSVEVRTDDGGGLSLRSEPASSSEQLSAVRDGSTVTIVDGPVYDGASNGWYLVNNGSMRAYAYAGFLVASSQQPAASSQLASSSSSSQSAKFSVGDTATTEGTTNVRNGASVNGSQLGTFSGGDIVEVTDGPFFDTGGDDWYYIVGDSVQGFVMGDFLIAAAAAASNQTAPSSGATGSFIYPLQNYTFTQGYGCSSLGFYAYNAAWGCRVHNGIDLAAPSYTPILAADGGTVVEAGWCDCGLGYYVKIDHGNGLASLYGHMAEMPYVRAGQSVNQGDTIGPIGSTGLSTGPHTHFMIQENGVTVNPLDYL